MTIDIERGKREQMRWLILLTLNAARPLGAPEGLILTCITDQDMQVTTLELRRELDYLEDRGLIELDRGQRPAWTAQLTRTGVDVVEYTVECEPGIARPKKYW